MRSFAKSCPNLFCVLLYHSKQFNFKEVHTVEIEPIVLFGGHVGSITSVGTSCTFCTAWRRVGTYCTAWRRSTAWRSFCTFCTAWRSTAWRSTSTI